MEPELRSYHRAVLGVLRGLPDHRSLRYLELGCGDGALLELLHRDGVRSALGTTFLDRERDYVRRREHPGFLTVDRGLDLNRPLPYPDAQFDVVFSTEVIEHVEGHRTMVREAARVLVPGGWLVLTTPNLHRILSRILFALSGIHMTKQALIPWSHGIERMEEFHHRCVDFPLLHWLLWRCGMRVQDIRPTEVYALSRLALVLKPILRPVTRAQVMRHAGAEREDLEGRRDLLRWMMSNALLTSEQICLTARKLAASATPS